MNSAAFMPSDPGWQPPCSDMIRTPESGSSAIAARIMDTAARLFGVARDRFATPDSATASQGSGAWENDGLDQRSRSPSACEHTDSAAQEKRLRRGCCPARPVSGAGHAVSWRPLRPSARSVRCGRSGRPRRFGRKR